MMLNTRTTMDVNRALPQKPMMISDSDSDIVHHEKVVEASSIVRKALKIFVPQKWIEIQIVASEFFVWICYNTDWKYDG